MMDSCGKFNCNFSPVGSIVRTDTQTDADERFTPASLVGVSEDDIAYYKHNLTSSIDFVSAFWLITVFRLDIR